MKKEELFKEIEESCKFLYHNSPEILQYICSNEEIMPLVSVLRKYDAEISRDTLLRKNINRIYGLIEVKGQDIPLEINTPDKIVELQNELVKKTIAIIKNANEIFGERTLESSDEEIDSSGLEQEALDAAARQSSFNLETQEARDAAQRVADFLTEVGNNSSIKRAFLNILSHNPTLLRDILELPQAKRIKTHSNSPISPQGITAPSPYDLTTDNLGRK